MSDNVNVIYRGRGIGAICMTCKTELCVNPNASPDQKSVSLGECQVCGANSKVCSPVQFGGIRWELK